MMTYKGYSGAAEIDFETGMIHGRVVGLRDVITFQGATVAEASQAFHDSVDDYLNFCASRGEPPEKPFSGKFLVRIDPALHRTLATEAAARGVSLNSLIEATLGEAFPPRSEPKPKKPKPKSAATTRRPATKATARPAR
jgi:predicted HicB family RNase H-like nuclease